MVAKNKTINNNIDNHDSDCATHNEPAYKNGKCDCPLSKVIETTKENAFDILSSCKTINR